MKVKIDVTKGDIESGIPCRPGFCPVALACKRQLGYIVLVDGFTIQRFGTPTMVVELPQAVQDFVSDFDGLVLSGRSVMKPFSFEIEVP